MTDIPRLREQDIEAIAERERKATKGPWVATFGYDGGATVAIMRDWRDGNVSASIIGPDGWIHDAPKSAPDDNAEFLAHARQDIPDLLDALAASEARVQEQAQEIARVRSRADADLVETGRMRAALLDRIDALENEKDAAESRLRGVEAELSRVKLFLGDASPKSDALRADVEARLKKGQQAETALKELREQHARYENAQCITCASDLDSPDGIARGQE